MSADGIVGVDDPRMGQGAAKGFGLVEQPLPTRTRLERHVTLGLEVRELERVLGRLAAAGVLGEVALAGDAAVAMVAAGLALEPDDRLFGTRRDVPAALARGTTLQTVLHQAFGVAGDPSLGRGLPGAVNDAEHGVALSDSSPASHLVHAAGFGLAAQLRGGDRIALGLAGAAALEHGEWHAALNHAAVAKARTIFVLRGPLGPTADASTVEDAWAVPVVTVPGDDAEGVYAAVVAARERALAGEGPTLVDARLRGEAMRPLAAKALQAAGGWPPSRRQEVLADIEARLRAARTAAEQAAAPDVSSVIAHVFAESAGAWWLDEELARAT